MRIKKWVAGVALGLTAVVGAGGVAAAATGAGGGDGAGAPAQAQAETKAEARGGKRAAALRLRQAVVRVVAETTNTTPEQVKEALRGGQSIADYAAANGSSAEAVKAALLEAGNARIDEAVAAGKLTQERGDALKAKLAERIDQMLTRTRPARNR